VPADAKKLYYRIELRFIPCGSATPVMTQLMKSGVADEKLLLGNFNGKIRS
jgi:hypothetical protein